MNCFYCGEPVLSSDRPAPVETTAKDGSFALLHYECQFRMIMGSVGHLRGECECYGKEDMSEQGITLREGAKAALAYYEEQKHAR